MNLFSLFASHNLTLLAIWNPDGSVNAIVPQVAAEFIQAFCEVKGMV